MATSQHAKKRAPGELGSRVLYVCPGEHNAPRTACEPGDVHTAFVADVLSRDEATGAPRHVLLAVLAPGRDSIMWARASWAPRHVRQPGYAGVRNEVLRMTRGAPPSESATPPDGGWPSQHVLYALDFPPGSWHGLDE